MNLIEDGNIEFNENDTVCFCFGYTRKQIEDDYVKNNRSTIYEKIAEAKKAGGCECAVKNPKGR